MIFIDNFLRFYSFERQRDQERAKGEGEGESDSALSREPNVGVDFRTLRS